MGEIYNAGYLAAVAAGTYYAGGVLRQAPTCPFERGTQGYGSWCRGVADAAKDLMATV